ncbi:MAG: prephenate dehydrogenase/arogenate dehydrogenase family protein [Patescibacteria group bacterium]
MRARRVGLAGLGLIGGSLGMALVAGGLEVVGYDADQAAVSAALAAGAVTAAAARLEDLAGSEVVIVATPVRAVVPTVLALAPRLRPGTIVSDTASVKGEIVSALATRLPAGIHFVGGHPMAGSERAGLPAADPYLFENAAYVLCPAPVVPDRALEDLQAVLACTGARFLRLDPAEHDAIAAGVSHLPHLAAAALVNAAAACEARHPGTLTLAGGGFRDTTRIAGGDAALWVEILAANREPLLRALAVFRAELALFEKALAPGREADLAALLTRARAVREEVPARGKGLLGKVEELVVAVQDRPGAIKQVLDVLADGGINVKDLEIMRLREGEGGTLRVALEDEATLARALGLLASAGLRARKR